MSGIGERFLRMKRCEYWVIAWRKRCGSRTVFHDQSGFQLLPQKRYITQADPFLFTYQGKNWLFYERQDLTDMKGTLWCRNLDEPKEKPYLVLEEPFHLSYPQVFQYGKYMYLLPETRNAGEVRLYRCVRFPGEWERVTQLFPLSAVDTTLTFSAELPEGYAGSRQGEESCFAFTYTEGRLELYHFGLEKERFRPGGIKRIYVSDCSKVVRPGGRVFTEGQKVYRPAQNCTDYYGQELILYEIDRLDEQVFAEHEAFRLLPEQFSIPQVNPVGIHTYNRNADYEVIDVLHREVSLRTIGKKIEWKCRGSRG